MTKQPAISFEFFPPRDLGASFRLWETVQALAPLNPDFVSVTYGAGGTTRQLTHEAVETISRHYALNVSAHLTCVGATRAETLAIAKSYAAAGVKEIVALRGDPELDADGSPAAFQPHPDGFANSVELVRALAETGDFTLRVGAYPERHPEAADLAANVTWLKQKIDAGASGAITQFFFEAESFLRFRDACAAAGITAPITPGVLPVTDWAGTKRFAARCGASIPAWLDDAFTRAIATDNERLLATAIATELCDDLLCEGVEALHFYTLNRPQMTRDVCQALGINPSLALEKVA
ncbi:MAG: methylenetetrahydrofolate reductase [NAD(P)H] [Paracoccaceae bacterium]